MLSNIIRHKSILNIAGFCLFLIFFFYVLPVYAQGTTAPTTPTPETILTNIQKALPNLMRLVTAFAYVIGITMVIVGIMQLKHVGEMRTQMSHEHHLTKPLLMITMGALLIYLPSAVQVGLSTFWSEPNPYGYLTQSSQWQQALNVCYAVVQFIGVIAFIRGLIILSHVGGGGQQGALAKGIMHIIGGIFCINLYQFIQVIFATIGIQQ